MSEFRYIGVKRRAKEHPRFVAGRGRFVADVVLPGMKHVALVASPHAAARIVSIDTSAAARSPGVLYVLTGEELCANTDPLMIGVDAPQVKRWPLARGVVRYAGEWVAAIVADSRALAEDAAELVEVDYAPQPHVVDAEAALAADAALVHPLHGSNVLYRRKFVWGPVEQAFANAQANVSFRAYWGRSATVPIETFGVVASWDAGTELLDLWASIQMPKYSDQTARALRLPGNAVRVHYDVDVGGSYGVKRGIKHTVLAGYLSRRLGAPVRLIEDRLENMRGGGLRPRRHAARAAHPRARRRRRVCGTLAAATRQARWRHLRALPRCSDRIRADLGHDQQDAAGGGARLRPVADELRPRTRDGPGRARARHGRHRAEEEEPDPQG
jgi:3-oxo-Delta1-steroid hydratase/dehydrogenase large subunit